MSEDGLGRSRLLLDAGRPEQALAELARLPSALGVSPPAFGLRAEAYLNLERWSEAADAARRGLAAGGPDARLLGYLGMALQQLGDYPAAERAVLDALALHPDDAWLLCHYAELCLAVGQLDKAGQLWERAAAKAPSAPFVLATRVRLLLARGDDRGAERASEQFLAEYPEHPVALALHGSASALRGRTARAHASFRQAVAADPTDRDYAEAAFTTRATLHPLLRPLRPLYRVGPIWAWAVAVAVIFGLRAIGLRPLAALLGLLWFVYCVYSWVAPPLVRRLTRWR